MLRAVAVFYLLFFQSQFRVPDQRGDVHGPITHRRQSIPSVRTNSLVR
jgi:hypothetical protein